MQLVLKHTGLFLSTRENILNNFKIKIFPTENLDKITTPKPALEPTVFYTPKPKKKYTKKSPFKIYILSVKLEMSKCID